MNISDLETILIKNIVDKTEEFKRLFHGRGGCYNGFEFLTVDSLDKVLYIVFFNKIDENLEKDLFGLFYSLYKKYDYTCVVLQRRYILKEQSEVLYGNLPNEVYAIEFGLKYKLNILSSRNIGYFGDMKYGREFISQNCKDKKVLNLFSYTCAFSVAAINACAKLVVNVDMSKGALTTGRQNHHINNLSTTNVQFMPYNILKSWNRIKKFAPYDLIIIDPPTFQKGSFVATNDYVKIVKRLDMLASDDCIVLAATNSPEIDCEYIKNIFQTEAKEFKYIKRLDNLTSYCAIDEQKSLKNLVFKKQLDTISQN